MQRRSTQWVLVLVLVCAASAAAQADDSCNGFKWDVGKEHLLFGTPAALVAAGKDVASAPGIGIDRLYALALAPQSEVLFAVKPGRPSADDSYAGLTFLDLTAAGAYRVSVDAAVWLDVTVGGGLAAVVDFQGQHGCTAPRKVVEFVLEGARRFVLQVSGSTQTTVHLTVTKSPPQT